MADKMRTTWGNKEGLGIFSPIFLIFENTWIRLTPYQWQSCVSQFCNITKGIILQNFSQTKKRDYQLVAMTTSSLAKSENLATATGTW